MTAGSKGGGYDWSVEGASSPRGDVATAHAAKNDEETTTEEMNQAGEETQKNKKTMTTTTVAVPR